VKIAVIQHRIRPSVDEDIDVLTAAITSACQNEAQVVVCPWVPSIAALEPASRSLVFDRLTECAHFTEVLLPFESVSPRGEIRLHETMLGLTAFMLGDECLTSAMYDLAEGRGAGAWIWRPLATSALQAEAFLELAMVVSASHTGLVVIVEPSGAEPGEIGHGSSAILYLGNPLAEAVFPDEIIMADLEIPVPLPDPRVAIPPLPPILERRLAVKEGRKPRTGYLEDLS